MFGRKPPRLARTISSDKIVSRKPTKKELSRSKTVTVQKRPPSVRDSQISENHALESFLLCSICANIFEDPRMLTCQHTFCRSCLVQLNPDISKFCCPTCKVPTALQEGGLNSIPKNMYINSLLRMFKEEGKPISAKVERCVDCGTAPSIKPTTCQHCKQDFCGSCLPGHLKRLGKQLKKLHHEVISAKGNLEERTGMLKNECDAIRSEIDSAIEVKIANLHSLKGKLLKKLDSVILDSQAGAGKLQERMERTEMELNENNFNSQPDNTGKISLFMALHDATSELLGEVSRWGEIKPVFDKDSLKVELKEESTRFIDDTEGKDTGFKNKSAPKLYLSRDLMERPCGVAECPWPEGKSHLYVAGCDSRQIVVIDKTKGRIVKKISPEGILCPQAVAFFQDSIYVTDKWGHCIHVLDKDGQWTGTLSRKGSSAGHLRSPEGLTVAYGESGQPFIYVCDTGNDRVQVLRLDGTVVKVIGQGDGYQRMELDQPTDVAVGHGKIVVADSGNNRVRVYSMEGEHWYEFGSGKGTFRSPECVAIDSRGFILVGDSGNGRIQVFDETGVLVRILGSRGIGPGKLLWISGLTTTQDGEVVVTDSRTHTLQIFV